jgi:hypothetical protein
MHGLLLVLLVTGVTGEKTLERVAILDIGVTAFDDDARRTELSATLTQLVAAEIALLGHDAVSRADLNAMLSLEKQKDLVGCEDDTGCIAEIGGALGVDLVVSGTLGRVGDTLSLSLTLIDIQTATVRERFQGSCGSEDALIATAKRGARALFGQAADASGTGTLYVKTTPPGARVLLDGKEVGLSPATIDEVVAGDHVVRAEKDDLRANATVRVEPDRLARLELQLEGAPPVALKVLSEPPEALVFLDGEKVGATPLILAEVAAGAHTVRLEHDDCWPHEEELSLSHEEYEKTGGVPFKLQVSLESRPRIPIPLSLSVGGVVEMMEPGDGVGLLAELSYLTPWRWLEVGVGYSHPTAIPATLRFWYHWKILEVGALVRAAAYRSPDLELWGIAVGGGVAAGVLFDVGLGFLGVRLEGTVSIEADDGGGGDSDELILQRTKGTASHLTVPVVLSLVWRPR